MALDHPSSPSVRFSGPLRDLADLDTAQNSGRIPRPVSTHSIEPTRALAAETSNLARIFHKGIEQRSGEGVRRLDIIEPNESTTRRFFYDRL